MMTISDKTETVPKKLYRLSELLIEGFSLQQIFDGASNQDWGLFVYVEKIVKPILPWDTNRDFAREIDFFLRKNGKKFLYDKFPTLEEFTEKGNRIESSITMLSKKVNMVLEINRDFYKWMSVDNDFYFEFSWGDIDSYFRAIYPYPCQPIVRFENISGYPTGKFTLNDILVGPEVLNLLKPIRTKESKSVSLVKETGEHKLVQNKQDRGGKDRSIQVLAATISLLMDEINGDLDSELSKKLVKPNRKLNITAISKFLEDRSQHYFDVVDEGNKNFSESAINKHLSENLSKYLVLLERRNNKLN
tara:strand:- start:60950 stop:61861 length:912 start_codon:yes stop_codon:yes gene_type:complete